MPSLPTVQQIQVEAGAGLPLVVTPDSSATGVSLSGVPLQFVLQPPNAPSANATPTYLVTTASGAYPITVSGAAPSTITVPLPRAVTRAWPVGQYTAELTRTDTDTPIVRLSVSVVATARPGNT